MAIRGMLSNLNAAMKVWCAFPRFLSDSKCLILRGNSDHRPIINNPFPFGTAAIAIIFRQRPFTKHADIIGTPKQDSHLSMLLLHGTHYIQRRRKASE